jgi:hypothetical protein
MPKTFRDVELEFSQFRSQFPDDPTDLPTFAKQLDEMHGTPGERSQAYNAKGVLGAVKKVDSLIDRGFEATGLPDVTQAGAEFVGEGFDALAGTKITPTVSAIGRDLRRRCVEYCSTWCRCTEYDQ